MAHKHSVYDTDAHLTIVPTSRKIIGAERIKLVRGDHNSSRVTFDIPRYVDGHDMAETSIVEIHYINISADGKNTNEDVYPADDVQLSPESDDVVIFSWLISNNATKYAGTLSFMLCFKCVTGEVLDYSWRTDTAKGVHVLKSLDCTPSAVADITDILTAWEMKIADLMGRVESMEDAIGGKLDKVTNSSTGTWQCYAIKANGEQTMQSFGDLPKPYTLCNRGDGGVVGVGYPKNETHAIPLGFADGRYVAQLTDTHWAQRLYGVETDGTPKIHLLRWQAEAYSVAQRGEYGTLVVGMPRAGDNATTKTYVDDKCSWQSGYVAGANEYIATISTDFSGLVDVPTATAENVYIPMLGRDSIELLVTVKDADGELHSEYVEISDLGEGQLMGYSIGRFGLVATEDASGDLCVNVIASK